MNGFQRHLPAALAAIVLVALALPAAGQITCVWNAADGVFSSSKNWIPNDLPCPSDTVIFRTNATYKVTFDNEESSANLRVEAGVVTFDMAGNIYHAGRGLRQGTGEDESIMVSNATLVVTGGGQLRTDMQDYGDFGLKVLSNGVLKVTGGSQVVNAGGGYYGAHLSEGRLVVDGSGSAFIDNNNYGHGLRGEITVQNGGLFQGTGYPCGMVTYHALPGGPARWTITGPGSKAVLVGSIATSYGGNISLIVTNGGEVVTSAGISLIGNSGELDQNHVWIGGPGEPSALISSNVVVLAVGTQWAGVGHVTVSTNGTLRVLGGGIFVGDGPASYDRTSDFTLGGGVVELGTNLVIDLQRDSSNDAYTPTFRGVGTIQRCVEGANFVIRNDGWIKPGDLATNQPGIGALAVTGGDLLQTNQAAPTAGLHFTFDETACDQIVLGGGLARITAGSNVFALAGGAPKPVPKQRYGSGEYNFIIATNLTYRPAHDNLVPLLTKQCGLTEGEDFRYGVVALGDGRSALQLAFGPAHSHRSTIHSSIESPPRSWAVGSAIALGSAILVALLVLVWRKGRPRNPGK